VGGKTDPSIIGNAGSSEAAMSGHHKSVPENQTLGGAALKTEIDYRILTKNNSLYFEEGFHEILSGLYRLDERLFRQCS